MSFFKKLKFWRRRRRRRDGAVSQKHSEKHTENLEEGDTNKEQMENLEEGDTNKEQILCSRVAELLEILEERDREEANLRRSITEYEKTLEKEECLKKQAETELYGWVSINTNQLKEEISKRKQMEATFRDTISGLEKQLEEAKCWKNEAEAKMCGLEKRLKEKDREMDQMEAACRDKIIILVKRLDDLFLKNELEANLHGRDKQLKDSEIDHMEGTYHDKIITLQKELEEAKCWKNEAEAKMCGLEEKLKEKDSERYKMKGNYRDRITGLKKKAKEKISTRNEVIRALRGHIETGMQATFHTVKTATERVMEETEHHCRQVETKLNGQISQTEELERKLKKCMCFQKEQMHDWKNVEKALRAQIKELKQKVSLMESEKEKVVDTLPCHLKAQTDAQQQTDGMYEVEIFSSQIKELNEKLQEQMNIH